VGAVEDVVKVVVYIIIGLFVVLCMFVDAG
jgi:hypothetical protein